MKKTLLFLFTLTFTQLFAQSTTEKELETIETPEQIESYLATKNSKKNKVITFNEEKHKTILAKALFKLGTGRTKTVENEFEKTFYKVVAKKSKTYYRASYIYLDGSKYTLESINDLRKNIIGRYNAGATFNFLAKQYSMDANANKGGDLGWFTNGDLHPDFEQAILKNTHTIGEAFTLDIPSQNWYYVVVLTEEPKEIPEIEVLKIVEPKV